MSRQLEQEFEDRNERERLAVLQAVYGGISQAVDSSGGELHGFSAKLSNGDCLLTIRAVFEGAAQICFVGSEDLPAALRKAVKEIHTDQVSWRQDRYAR